MLVDLDKTLTLHKVRLQRQELFCDKGALFKDVGGYASVLGLSVVRLSCVLGHCFSSVGLG